ncbi:uncharacterized protein N0V89_008159 [Didymosphaeria variabile]|uniref:Uncharacterized protein n=1 Tax=Didymosphaeria variabile TaxID=1932322 RepID=A0A9W8XFW5_9PLEO|nr:uncharacterized protein N0V89_008159 [Didymosphaeria variabile]KAJ4349543.1 hypothetical protein N0V89_008159 [Didymosphaeria variabile]
MDGRLTLPDEASMSKATTKSEPANKMANRSFDFFSLPVELRVLVYQAYLDIEVPRVTHLPAQPDRYVPLHFGIGHPKNSDAAVGPLLSICYAFDDYSVEPFSEVMRLAGLNSPYQPSGVYRIVLTGKPLPAPPGFMYNGISEIIHNGGVMDSIREVDVLSHLEPGSVVNPQDWLAGVTLCPNVQTLNIVFKPRAMMGKSKPRMLNNRPKGAVPLLEDRLAQYHARDLHRYVGVLEDPSRMVNAMTYGDLKLFQEYHTLVEEYGADFETKPEFSNPKGDHEFHLLSVEQIVERFRLRELLKCRQLKVACLKYSLGCSCSRPNCSYANFGVGPVRAQEGSVREVTVDAFQELMGKVAFWLQNEFATKNRQWVFVQSLKIAQKKPSNFYYKQA